MTWLYFVFGQSVFLLVELMTFAAADDANVDAVDAAPSSLWEMVQLFKCLSANVKTLDADGGEGDDEVGLYPR
jgi:hypothetical protein